MATPLGGVSAGRGLLGILGGFGEGMQQGMQTAYQRRMAQNQFEMNQAYKQQTANAASDRVEAAKQHWQDMQDANFGRAADTAYQHLQSGLLTRAGFNQIMRGLGSTYSRDTTPWLLSEDGAGAGPQMGVGPEAPSLGRLGAPVASEPGGYSLSSGTLPDEGDETGMGAPPVSAQPASDIAPAALLKMGKDQAAIDSSRAGTGLKTAQTNLTDTKNGSAKQKQVNDFFQEVGIMPPAQQPGYVEGVNAASGSNYPVPGKTVVGQRQVPIAGPPTQAMLQQGQEALPPSVIDLLAPSYSPDVKTAGTLALKASQQAVNNARVPEINSVAALNGVRATNIPLHEADMEKFHTGLLANGVTANDIRQQGVTNSYNVGMANVGVRRQEVNTRQRHEQWMEQDGADKAAGISGYGTAFDKMQARRSAIAASIVKLTTPTLRQVPVRDSQNNITLQTVRTEAPANVSNEAKAQLNALRNEDAQLNQRMYQIKAHVDKNGGPILGLLGRGQVPGLRPAPPLPTGPLAPMPLSPTGESVRPLPAIGGK